jgi:uncharacterized protein YjiS (DUF1127 family)
MFKLTTFKSDGAFWPQAQAPDLAGTGQSLSRLMALLGAPRRVWGLILREMAARRAMQSLASLDDRMLRDIGIDRCQIDYACRHGRHAVLRSSELGADVVRWS